MNPFRRRHPPSRVTSRKSQPTRRGLEGIEALEDRRLLAGFSYAGNILSITLNAATTLSVSSAGGGAYTFSLSGADTFSGTDTTGLTGNGIASLAVTTALGLDSVLITNSIANTAVSLVASTGDYVDDFSVNLNSFPTDPAPSFQVASAATFVNASDLSVTAPNIAVNANLITAQGTITLKADSGAQLPGSFSGLTVSGATVSSTSGAISLSGRGGNAAAGGQIGVALLNATVRTGNAGGIYGTVTIEGTGGTVSGAGTGSHGVTLDSRSTVASSGGLISITGTGGGMNTGNLGVVVDGRISTAGGSGANIGPITIKGTGGGNGGTTATGNSGVALTTTSVLQATKGAISVTGISGAGQTLTTPPLTTSPGLSIGSGVVASSSGDITFTADTVTFPSDVGTIATNGIVTLRNITAGQLIPLNQASNSVISQIIARSIVIGRTDARPDIEQAAGDAGTLTLGNTDLLLIGSKIGLNANITTGGSQSYDGPVILGNNPAAVDPTLTGNGITFLNSVDGAKNLQLVSTGSVVLKDAVGATTPLASLRLVTASSVMASKALKIDGSATGAAADGLTVLAGVSKLSMDAAGSSIANCAGNGISLSGLTGSTISGFTLTKNALAGIKVAGASTGTTISGNTIDGGGIKDANGVSLQSATGVTVGTAAKPNAISGTTVGVVATGTLTGSAVRANTVTGGSGGLQLAAAQGLTVNGGNKFVSSTIYGVYANGDCTGTTVSGNAIANTPHGVYLNGATNLSVGAPGGANVIAAGANTTGSYVGTATSVGVYATGALTGTTVGVNSIVDNTIGVYLTSATGLTIRGANLFRNRSYGVFATGADTSTVLQSNTISGVIPGGPASSYGVYLQGATGLQLGTAGAGNNIASNSCGIYASGVLTGTTIAANGVVANTTGIQLQSAQNLAVARGNDVRSNSAFALYAAGNCSGTSVRGSTYRHSSTGMYLDSVQNLIISGNQVVSNSSVGLFARGASTGTSVTGNVIRANVQNVNTVQASGGTFQKI
ncbi:MAG: hypothetical protein DWH79_00990 [Planctomycetota bacterium]|nr:MAG: hypothetical protein DWH79_00990 [Planctomycetota bacterium]